jgi:hypothetical protein
MVWKSNATTNIEAKVVVKAEASLLCSSAFKGSVDGVVVLLVVDDDFDEDETGVDDSVFVAAVSSNVEDPDVEDPDVEESDDEDDSPGAASPSVEDPFTIANHLPKF